MNKYTNGTGTVGLVVTPVGGLAWAMAEDLVDEHIIMRLERKGSNPLYLFTIQFLNPCRGFANLLRFKAPWYRDSRPTPREKDYPKQLDSFKNPALVYFSAKRQQKIAQPSLLAPPAQAHSARREGKRTTSRG